MRKKILVVIMAVCLLVSMMTIFPFAEDITPDTTWYNDTDTSFTLYDAADLAGLASLVNAGTDNFSGKTIVLGNSINLNNEAWTPIGTYSYPFSGTFDGNGCTVSGLYINDTLASQQALFGYNNGGTIKNVTVSGTVTGNVSVAGVVGYNDSGTVTNCINNVLVSAYSFVGGVVGTNNKSGTVTNCYNNGSISGNGNVGGVVGVNYGTMKNCCNNGSITNSATGYDFVGGVVGYNSSTVTNCYNSGAVSGYRCVGGVVGYNTGEVKSCYNSGTVSCTSQTAGGVIGHNYSSASTTNCYYLDGSASAAYRTNDGTLTNVESKTSTQFASGEVTWLLTGGVTDGTQAWYQTLGTDSYPVLDSTHKTVCYGTNCENSTVYSNTDLSTTNGHSWNEGVVTTEATCTEDGVKTYTCEVCGETKTETVEATGHTYGEPEWTWDGTTATATFTCSGCGEVQTVEATVTSVTQANAIVYTATAELDGVIYTATKTISTSVPTTSANYSAVSEAIAKANALNPDDYEDFSAVTRAINNVDWTLSSTNQSAVNSMAAAINEAITNLVPVSLEEVIIDEPVEGTDLDVEAD